MTVEIVTSLTLGFLVFSTSIAMIVLDNTDDYENKEKAIYISWAPKLVIVITMFIASTLMILLIIFARKVTIPLQEQYADHSDEFFVDIRSNTSWCRYFQSLQTYFTVRPTFHEKPPSPIAKWRLFGIALFLIVGVYTEDLAHIFGEICCADMWRLCSVNPVQAARRVELVYRLARLIFSTTAALLCFLFVSRRFVQTFPTLSSLSVVTATTLMLWIQTVVEESDLTPDKTKLRRNFLSSNCHNDFTDLLPPNLTVQLVKCVELNTSVFRFVDNASPYLSPLIIELLMLFVEFNTGWFFGSMIVEAGYEQITEEPPIHQDLYVSHSCQYGVVLASGLMNVLFFVLGLLSTLDNHETYENMFSEFYASFRIVYWSLLCVAAAIGFFITHKMERNSRASQLPTGFEYFVIFNFLGILLFEVFTMAATIIHGQDKVIIANK